MTEGKPSILAGLLTCGKCGSTLARATSRRKVVYRCSKYNNNGKEACTSHRISEDVFLGILSDNIAAEIAKINLNLQAIEEKNWIKLQQKRKDAGQIHSSTQKRLSAQIERNQLSMKKLLEEGAKGYIPNAIFQEQLSNLHTELGAMWNELNNSNVDAEALQKRKKREPDKTITLIEKFLYREGKNRQIFTGLIEKIEVHEKSEKEKYRNVKLKIKYRFVIDVKRPN